MKNLALSTVVTCSVDGSHVISSIAVDLDGSALYAVSEQRNVDASIKVEIIKTSILAENGNDMQMEAPTSLAIFNTYTSTVGSQVVSLHVLPDSRLLSIIMRCGDIASFSLDDPTSVEIEGSIEAGILASSWSPDDSLLVIVTGDDKLLLMTPTYDVLSEKPLHTSDFGDDAPINVGWGSKQTQFHGSEGKSAAQAQKPSLEAVGASPDDDTVPRISWRGDGVFFVVSALWKPPSPEGTGQSRRILRVYDRQGVLQSTADPVPGLEHVISWRPSGNLLVSTQRFGFEGGGAGKLERHDVVFFERNGLRHGEFTLREPRVGGGDHFSYHVKEVTWSSDSNVLAVWISRQNGDVVQLWTTCNYHWYLKHEIAAPQSASYLSEPDRFTSIMWHPEKALCIVLTTNSKIIQRSYFWDTFVSRSEPPDDTGSVAVLDSPNILLTPFRVQNVPPPLSSFQLKVPGPSCVSRPPVHTPVHLSYSSVGDMLAVLWESGLLEIWALNTRIGASLSKVMDPVRVWTSVFPAHSRQVHVVCRPGSSSVAVLSYTESSRDMITVMTLSHEGRDTGEAPWHVPMFSRNGRLVFSPTLLAWQAPDGEIYNVHLDDHSVSPISRFPDFCFSSENLQQSLDNSVTPGFVGLSASGALYFAYEHENKTIANNVNSVITTPSFVIFTTTAHEAVFVPVPTLISFLGSSDVSAAWEKRRVERGSRIVITVPSAMCLVLQMPRGNLETISPRPLVIEVVKHYLDNGQYRQAFSACRRHRIDLKFLVEYDQSRFIENVVSFVEQIDDVDYINVFLTSLGRGSLSAHVVAGLCDTIRQELESKDLSRYVNSILTAFVAKSPPDYEGCLAFLLRLREIQPNTIEDAIKYVIFLVDADRLFDTALGMYDFSLVLMIAQHAQKDPREYLPFLRDLRALDKYYQRYRIDDHLRRHESALRNLSLAGESRFGEALAYIETHRLYQHALSIWRNSEYRDAVLNIYGEWLFERREFRQAASVWCQTQQHSKAMIAYERALEWRELFDLAYREKTPEGDIVAMGYRVSEELSSKKRYTDAAQVLLDYCKDVKQAVGALVEGNHFSEARRIISLHGTPDMIDSIIYPAASESRTQLAEDIREMKDQMRRQVNRLRELRKKRVEEPDAFFGVEDTSLHNVDVMTDVSMAETAFTRYTAAPSTSSQVSKRSSRSKRKLERKIGSGRKGTVDEEEYLLLSITKLVARLTATQGEVARLLPHLLQLTSQHRTEGFRLQVEVGQFEVTLKDAVEEVWTPPSPNEVDSWAKRMEAKENAVQRNPVETVSRPTFSTEDWRMKIIEADKSV